MILSGQSMFSFREAFGQTLLELGEHVPNLVVVDADVFKSTRTQYFAEKFSERFITVGISEQDLVGVVAGLALGGKIPIASTYAMFMMRGWEQIRNTIARDHLNVKFIATHGGLSDYLDGASHQCLEDIAVMRVIPGMTVLVPADDIATKQLLFQSVVEHKGPLYMRLGRDNAYRIYNNDTELKIGRAELVREGSDITIVANGTMVAIALEVATLLKEKNVSADVIDMHTVKPLDTNILIRSASKTGRVVTIEEHNIIGGLGSAVSEELSEYKPVMIKRIGVMDVFGTAGRSYEELLEYFGLVPEHIVRNLEVFINQ
ncbi:MAG: transketolase family protein [Thermoprotei archaeon]